jgi:hypothetical protein
MYSISGFGSEYRVWISRLLGFEGFFGVGSCSEGFFEEVSFEVSLFLSFFIFYVWE